MIRFRESDRISLNEIFNHAVFAQNIPRLASEYKAGVKHDPRDNTPGGLRNANTGIS